MENKHKKKFILLFICSLLFITSFLFGYSETWYSDQNNIDYITFYKNGTYKSSCYGEGQFKREKNIYLLSNGRKTHLKRNINQNYLSDGDNHSNFYPNKKSSKEAFNARAIKEMDVINEFLTGTWISEDLSSNKLKFYNNNECVYTYGLYGTLNNSKNIGNMTGGRSIFDIVSGNGTYSLYPPNSLSDNQNNFSCGISISIPKIEHFGLDQYNSQALDAISNDICSVNQLYLIKDQEDYILKLSTPYSPIEYKWTKE